MLIDYVEMCFRIPADTYNADTCPFHYSALPNICCPLCSPSQEIIFFHIILAFII
jgi:hypothetical protein